MKLRQILVTGLFLFLFALVGTALVSGTFLQTRDRIAANERAALLRSLHALIPDERHDNDIFEDTRTLSDPLLGDGEPVTMFLARRNEEVIAAVFATTAPDGYNGTIKLLVGVNADGTLAGARVIAHRETPGLGDGIEEQRSDWILGFTGRSLGDPPLKEWAVKRDGGVFDQFTGATITPRAVIKAIRNTLLYCDRNRARVFLTDSAQDSADAKGTETAQ